MPLLVLQISIDASFEHDANLPSDKTANKFIMPDSSSQYQLEAVL